MTIKFKSAARKKFIKEWNSLVKINHRLDSDHDVERIFLKEDKLRMAEVSQVDISPAISVDNMRHFIFISRDDVVLNPPLDSENDNT